MIRYMYNKLMKCKKNGYVNLFLYYVIDNHIKSSSSLQKDTEKKNVFKIQTHM